MIVANVQSIGIKNDLVRFEWNFNAREFLSLEEPSINNSESYFGCGLYWGVTWRTVLKFSSSLSDYQKLFRKSEKCFSVKQCC